MRFLVLILCFASTICLGPEERRRPVLKEAPAAVVEIHVNPGRCTGFVVAQDLVITAAHCIGVETTDVVIEGRKRQAAVLLVGIEGGPEDVAVLQVPTGDVAPLQLAAHSPQLMPVIGVRFNRDLYPAFVTGRDHLHNLKLRGSIEGGDSGGPLIGEDLLVVGLVWGTRLHTYDAVGVPVEVIRHAIKVATEN